MEVNVGNLYKVVITEYESGWGQRCDPDDTKFFTTLEEAKAYKEPVGKNKALTRFSGAGISQRSVDIKWFWVYNTILNS